MSYYARSFTRRPYRPKSRRLGGAVTSRVYHQQPPKWLNRRITLRDGQPLDVGLNRLIGRRNWRPSVQDDYWLDNLSWLESDKRQAIYKKWLDRLAVMSALHWQRRPMPQNRRKNILYYRGHGKSGPRRFKMSRGA